MLRFQTLLASRSGRRPRERRRRRPRAPLWVPALALLLAVCASPSELRLVLGGPDTGALEAAVTAVGGRITHHSPRIAVLGAVVPEHRLGKLTGDRSVRRWWFESRVTAAGGWPLAGPAADEAPVSAARVEMVRADRLHAEGFTGRGITVAVVDGYSSVPAVVRQAADGRPRVLAVFDAAADRLVDPSGDPGAPRSIGHAESVLEAMLSSRRDGDGRFTGIAPDADLVLVRALGEDGSGRALDVIRGIDWVIANRERYGIRVLNLSLAGAPAARYWDDPLNRAVMAAWRAGIVVVVAAGNGGPEPATVAAPGDVPYVVTVGAAGRGPDEEPVALYSATGPTADGFVKPELLAPGSALAIVPASAGASRRAVGGTSVAAAVVSGVVALVLEAELGLTPDQVKHRLLAGARPAIAADGSLALPLLRQGGGLVDAWAAATNGSTAAANRGLDIERDLAGEQHFSGGRPESDFELRPEGLAEAYLWSYGAAAAPGEQPQAGGATVLGGSRPDGTNLGLLWSDRAVAFPSWPDPSDLGLLWSDDAVAFPSGPDGTNLGLLWSDRAIRSYPWFDE